MLFGYVRVKLLKPKNPNLQFDALLKEGFSEKNIYRRWFSSGQIRNVDDLDL